MTQWSDRYATGHPQIDADHQEFFRRADAMRAAIEQGAGAEKIAELLALLQEHALVHFQREEALMERVGCRSHGRNCAAHREFARKLEGWIHLLCLSGSSGTLLTDIHREASQWMEQHIAGIDCDLRHCRHAPDAGAQPPPLTAR